MNVPLEDLKAAHQRLMARYIALLDEVARASWWMPTCRPLPEETRIALESKSSFVKLWSWLARRGHAPGVFGALRFLVRLFVEGHIRAKLQDMAEAYLFLRGQALPDTKELREWAKENSEVCEKIAGTLASWASVEGALKLLWPLALSGLTAWLQVKDLGEAVLKLDGQTYAVLGFALVMPGFYLCTFMTSAFTYKREMFIPGFDADENRIPYAEPAAEANVYMLEDRLYEILERHKLREQPWDRYVSAIGLVIMGSLPVWGLFGSPEEQAGWLLWVFAGFLWLGAIRSLFVGKNRQWQ